ncbi:MAG: tetratricopeptide repeat protein, partial [Magnetococcales bacterium]|nr:tetratricopeptide repeat protein [Magnetococcales bacterium]
MSKPDAAIDQIFQNARALQQSGDQQGALNLYQAIMRQSPDHVATLLELSMICLGIGRNDTADALTRRAMQLAPHEITTLINRGVVLYELGDLDGAIHHYRQGVALDPELPELHYNLGKALEDQNQLFDALEAIHQALKLRPAFPEALNQMGNLLLRLNRPEEALLALRAAIELRPNFPPGHYNEGLVLLLTGDLQTGWEKYEHRWHHAGLAHAKQSHPQPEWDGKASLDGQRLLLYGEQGLGDMLQFIRYVPRLAKQGATVILESPASLCTLFKSIEGLAEITRKGSPPPAFDLHFPLLSLPHAFGTTLESIPATVPYLAPPVETIDNWRRRLGNHDEIRVGVVWSGNPQHHNDRNRSLPLRELGPLLDLEGFRFFSLQKEV